MSTPDRPASRRTAPGLAAAPSRPTAGLLCLGLLAAVVGIALLVGFSG